MKIVYWTSTGNTEEIANLIAEGLSKENIKAELFNISSDKVEITDSDSIIALGCPAMGDEELEEGEFRVFFDENKSKLNGKKVILFGSYGWGDGKWIRDWEEETEATGANVALEPLMVNYAPDDKEEIINYGVEISKLA
ncbi:flavodoxin [Clostridium sp.]|uniref:flavodoxin n=1 Tax=Clostridium sp. TaxID=1506 RepID=UPI0039966578